MNHCGRIFLWATGDGEVPQFVTRSQRRTNPLVFAWRTGAPSTDPNLEIDNHVPSEEGLANVFKLDHKMVLGTLVDLDPVAVKQRIVNAVAAQVDVVIAVVAIDDNNVSGVDHDRETIVMATMSAVIGLLRRCGIFGNVDHQRL